jgi:hypothetical protein
MNPYSPEFPRYPWWYVADSTKDGCPQKIVLLHLVAVDTEDQNESKLTAINIWTRK